MNNSVENELSAAISLMLEELRPGSMVLKVLEAMINKPVNGLPRMTYDLETANEKFMKGDPQIQVPTMWHLIAMDVAPYPGLWECIEYARDNAKAVRNAVYGLKEQFEMLNPEDEAGVSPVGLYIFNKHSRDARDINVVTPMPNYASALRMCQDKQKKLFKSRVNKMTHRSKVAGLDGSAIVRELAHVLHDARSGADLPPTLGAELKKLESK